MFTPTTIYHHRCHLFQSLSTNFNPVSFCPPFGFFASRLASFNALLSSVLSGIFSKCPYHLSIRSFTVLPHSFTPHFSYKSSFLILLGHLMFMIFFKVFLWKTSTVFSIVLSRSTVRCCIGICFVSDNWRVSSLLPVMLFHFQICVLDCWSLLGQVSFFFWCYFQYLVNYLGICIASIFFIYIYLYFMVFGFCVIY